MLWSVIVSWFSRGTWSSRALPWHVVVPCSVIAQRSFFSFRVRMYVRTHVPPGTLNVSCTPGYIKVRTYFDYPFLSPGWSTTPFYPPCWSIRCIWVVTLTYPPEASWSPLSMLGCVFTTAWGNEYGRGFRPANIPQGNITRLSPLLTSERVRRGLEVSHTAVYQAISHNAFPKFGRLSCYCPARSRFLPRLI